MCKLYSPKALDRDGKLTPNSLHTAVTEVQSEEIRSLLERSNPESGGESIHGQTKLGKGSGSLEHVVFEPVQSVHG